jgi:two-component system chemotaxis sensor kinase CheA
MNAGMEQFLEVFFEEAEEHLANLEHLLLTLDIAAPDREALDGIFRAAHSIKGSSGMFGFDDLTAVTHVLETLLDKIRSGQMALRVEMIDVFLQSRDVLGQLLVCHKHAKADPGIPVEATVSRLQTLIDSQHAAKTQLPSETENAYGLFDALPDESENVLAALDPHSAASNGAPEDDEFGFFDDQPGAPNQPAQIVNDDAYGLFLDAPAEHNEDTAGASAAHSTQQHAAPASSNNTALNPTPSDRRAGDRRSEDRRSVAPPSSTPAKPNGDAESSSIRVSVEKIDSLINQVGELVITQAMLAQLTAGLDPSIFEKINQALGQLEHNTRELQESVMSIRMLPISFIFNRFPSSLSDLSPADR